MDHWAIGLNLASLPEINKIAATKSASEKSSGVCREVGAGTFPPIAYFSLGESFFWFMALQVGHTQLLLTGSN